MRVPQLEIEPFVLERICRVLFLECLKSLVDNEEIAWAILPERQEGHPASCHTLPDSWPTSQIVISVALDLKQCEEHLTRLCGSGRPFQG